MNEAIILIFLILMVVICEAIAQSSAHMLGHTNDYKYLILGMIFYGIVVFLLSKAHRINNMGTVNGIWSGISILSISLVGYFIFGQKIKTNHILALIIIAVSVSYVGYTA